MAAMLGRMGCAVPGRASLANQGLTSMEALGDNGEEVINGTVNSRNFSDNNYVSQDEVFDGAYQLEIRTGTDYVVSLFDSAPFQGTGGQDNAFGLTCRQCNLGL